MPATRRVRRGDSSAEPSDRRDSIGLRRTLQRDVLLGEAGLPDRSRSPAIALRPSLRRQPGRRRQAAPIHSARCARTAARAERFGGVAAWQPAHLVAPVKLEPSTTGDGRVAQDAFGISASARSPASASRRQRISSRVERTAPSRQRSLEQLVDLGGRSPARLTHRREDNVAPRRTACATHSPNRLQLLRGLRCDAACDRRIGRLGPPSGCAPASPLPRAAHGQAATATRSLIPPPPACRARRSAMRRSSSGGNA